MTWNLSPSDNYSILSYYEKFRLTGPKISSDHLVWSSHIPPKFSFFMWLLCHKSIKTKQLFHRIGMQIDMSCCLCNAATESSDHLFFNCTFTKQVWSSVLAKYGIRRSPCSWSQEFIWLKSNGSGRNKKSKLLSLCVSCTVYSVWYERNHRLFDQSSKFVESVTNSIICLVDKIRIKYFL